jgi:hypothetical protein
MLCCQRCFKLCAAFYFRALLEGRVCTTYLVVWNVLVMC